jgi:endonuclease-3 related protein
MLELYYDLLDKYGYQGWWPINGHYHPQDYSYPHTPKQQFEIAIGAILTQNTNWNNVEKALTGLRDRKLLAPKKILAATKQEVKEAIRPAGYFNQKYKKLVIFSQFFLKQTDTPSREQLLQLWGVGPETADSILLYAYNFPTFVVDTYTKRVLFNHNLISDLNIDYHQLQAQITKEIPQERELYQEFHALLVVAAKNLKI